MFEQVIDTSAWHALWSGDCSRLGDEHPLPTEEIYPVRKDENGIAVIHTSQIYSDRTWTALRAAVAEATCDFAVTGIVLEFDIVVCQWTSKMDELVAQMERTRVKKPTVSYVRKAYGCALRAALSCNHVLAAPNCRTGLLRCDYPFIEDVDFGLQYNCGNYDSTLGIHVEQMTPAGFPAPKSGRDRLPDLGDYERMLRADVAKARPSLSQEVLKRMTLRSIDVVDSVRLGVVDGMAVDVAAAVQQVKEFRRV